MSPPIRDGSGSSIGSIRLGDGTEISEVRTGAGDVVFSGNAILDSVVHQYRFEQNATDSVGTLDASFNGNYISSSPLEGNYSGNFDGTNDALYLPNPVSVDETVNGITFEFLVNFDSVSSDTAVFEMKAQNTSWLCTFTGSGELFFQPRSSGNPGGATVTGLQTGVDYKIACQYVASNDEVEIAIDGAIDATNTVGAALDQIETTNSFGTFGGGDHLDATADDLRIHDSPLV